MSFSIGCRPDQQILLPFGNSYPKDFRFIKVLDSINDIPTPLRINSIYFVKNNTETEITTYFVNSSGELVTLIEYTSFPNPNFRIPIINKGDGDTITHPFVNARIITFYNSDDGGRQMNDFYATDIVENQFTLKNDFTTDKFNGELYCFSY